MRFLRENRIGTANVIALDKMEQHEARSRAHFVPPPESRRVFDLVKPA